MNASERAITIGIEAHHTEEGKCQQEGTQRKLNKPTNKQTNNKKSNHR